jgi:ABC-type multidrug transport system fused ATPase/permease subunit
MNSHSNNIILKCLASVRHYLTPSDNRRAIVLFMLQIVASVLDVFGLATLVPVIMLASSPGSVQRSKWASFLFNNLGFESEKSFLIFAVFILFVFFLIKNIFASLVNLWQVKFSAKIALAIIDDQFLKYTSLPFWKFQEIGTGNLSNEALGVPNVYLNGIIRQLFVLFSEIVIVFVVVVGILVYQPVLFVILAITLVPTTFLTYRVLRNRSHTLGIEVDKLRPKVYALVLDTFIGYVELKLANKLTDYRNRIHQNQEYGQSLEARGYLYGLLPVRIIEMVAIVAVITIFLYSLLISNDTANLVTIVGLFAAAAYRLMPSVNRILTSLVTIKQNAYTIDTLALLRAPEWRIDHVANQLPLTFAKTISFDQVTFAFPTSEESVLKDISFEVHKGEKIGFIGSSGSGKTTLMNLLLRFYSEREGRITVDGIPLSPEYNEAWYKLVGYVKQDTFLMDASLRDNITLAESQPDERRLQYALEQASLSDFVAGLPEGLNTVAGERGSKLSGGQRQRIGIARALYKQTQILVMDEATSALDNQTERDVSEAISKLANTDITIFIIAHRITTLRQCDRIYELKDGRIAAVYSYDELLAKHV